MALFLSNFTNKVDGQGRVSVPMTFRSALSGSAYRGLVLYKSRNPHCLEGGPREFLEKLANRLYSRTSPFDPSVLSVATTILAGSAELVFDPEGRIRLSEAFREYAGITTHATFVGLGPKFMVWNPDAYTAYEESQLMQADKDLLEVPSLFREGD